MQITAKTLKKSFLMANHSNNVNELCPITKASFTLLCEAVSFHFILGCYIIYVGSI